MLAISLIINKHLLRAQGTNTVKLAQIKCERVSVTSTGHSECVELRREPWKFGSRISVLNS